MDIQKAILAEEEYLTARLNGEEPFELAERLIDFGFSTLDEYFKAKIEFQASQLNFTFEETTPQLGAKKTMMLTAANTAGCIFGDTDSTCVFHGSEDFDEWYCLDNDIEVINYNAKGGNIVIIPGDLSCGINFPISEVNAEWILNHLITIIRKYESTAEVDGNDIMVNGKKIAGSAFYQRGESFGFVIHFSFSDRMELINAICNEDTITKIPGYIDFMTREQLKEEITQWLS